MAGYDMVETYLPEQQDELAEIRRRMAELGDARRELSRELAPAEPFRFEARSAIRSTRSLSGYTARMFSSGDWIG